MIPAWTGPTATSHTPWPCTCFAVGGLATMPQQRQQRGMAGKINAVLLVDLALVPGGRRTYLGHGGNWPGNDVLEFPVAGVRQIDQVMQCDFSLALTAKDRH